MPVDYSKWDALELSDDSDIEVHPNVDKRSFIRAKQSQIHQERQQRKLQIEAYKYEGIIHEGLVRRLESMVASLQQHAAGAREAGHNGLANVALKALVKTNPGPDADSVPPRPEGLVSEEPGPPTYTAMLAQLIDQIEAKLDKESPNDRYQALIAEFQHHIGKIQELETENKVKLAKLLAEEGKKITSADIHTGFNSSHVSKGNTADAKDAKTEVELLNPSFGASSSSGSQPAAGEDGDEEDDDIEASPAAKKFAQIPSRDYAASLQFLSQNPQILVERETDALLVLAFNAALKNEDDESRRCVHQALLLQYCRALGKDGVGLFFKRITTPGHQAQEIFYKDVQDTYTRIKNRSREIIAERAKEGEDGVEQIQLHAVEPGTVIQIKVPPADSQDADERRAREIFDGFDPDLKKALETGKLDEVNLVLGKMKVSEAEEIVALFGEANILSLEDEIIDATTEQGQQQLKDMEAAAKAEAEAESPVGDPE